MRLLDSNGKYVNQYLRNGARYKVFETKTINGQVMYRLGNQNQWIPATYSNLPNKMTNEKPAQNAGQSQDNGEQPYSGITIVVYHGRGNVRLLNNNGKYMSQYVKNGARYKVFGVKTINGQVMYRLGNQNQWIPAVYTNFPNTMKEKNPVNNAPAVNGSITEQGSPAVRGSKAVAIYANPFSRIPSNVLPAGRVAGVSARTGIDGVEWYKLADGSGWVKGPDVAVSGFNQMPVVVVDEPTTHTGGSTTTTTGGSTTGSTTGGSTTGSTTGGATTGSTTGGSTTGSTTGGTTTGSTTGGSTTGSTTGGSTTGSTTGGSTTGSTTGGTTTGSATEDAQPTWNFSAAYKAVDWGAGVKDRDVPQYASILNQGFDDNSYTSNDGRQADVRHLTESQKQELATFALNTVNAARRELNLPLWTPNKQAQDIANEVARNYDRDNWSLKKGHDVEGIYQACKDNGLDYVDHQNYVEDMGGFYHKPQATMGYLKEQIYYNVKQMLFGGKADSSYPAHEMNHARALLSHDHSDFGFSITYAEVDDGDLSSTHFINIRDSLRHYAQDRQRRAREDAARNNNN